ncbi:glycosyltransferase family 2 protein [Ferviditalea candida]|uniref:Glycosyltransferase family 2 protein n=1 Tax=Ferviditalea candida TaxID=3108399 RepID=A0ABU5ZFH7_9BACL|nr:glycosyltransferase family 2 protein [Paenibacillaceae bacterium T2]
MNNQIDILLSTYNGSKYLQELLTSIIDQIYPNWQLLIRDDGSTDDTIDVIQNFSKQYPNKIVYIEDHDHHLGPKQSFSKLMEYSTADYIMFCDQDDVWLNHKIELTLEKILLLEKKFPNQPLLVHTDLTVVDKDLQVISDSFWKYQKLNPYFKELNNLLVQNIATGCTMMMNKRLKELSLPIPKQAIMHDWWIALVASISSGIHHIDSPTLLYRQHGTNNIGAQKYSLPYLLNRFGKASESIERIIHQGERLSSKFSNQLNQDQLKMLESFINFLHNNRFNRLIDIFKYRFRKHGLLRNVGFILAMLFLNKRK